MWQYIRTRYIGPGNRLGARCVADTPGNGKPFRKFVPWVDDYGIDQNYTHAAKVLARQLGWHGVWVAGAANCHSVYVCIRHGGTKEWADRYLAGEENRDWFIL
jgi:hypothetical protein